MKNCRHCKTDLSHRVRNYAYCDTQCQKDHEWEQRKILIQKSGCFLHEREARRWLLEKNGCRCSVCNRKKWCGQDIPLTVDHIDGKHDNKRISNFRLICPNCDAQTPTYKGRNRGNGRHSRRMRYQEGKSY